MAKTGKRKVVNKSKKVKRSQKKTKRVIRRGRNTRKRGGMLEFITDNWSVPKDTIRLLSLNRSNMKREEIKSLVNFYLSYTGAHLLKKSGFYENIKPALKNAEKWSANGTDIGDARNPLNRANKYVLENFDIATDGKVRPKSTVTSVTASVLDKKTVEEEKSYSKTDDKKTYQGSDEETDQGSEETDQGSDEGIIKESDE
jgi:hypothetical protein